MTTESHNPRRGTRDNGLRCSGYTVVADLDPRVADSLLASLRDAGIAAYAEPTPGRVGGYMETQLPSTPTDRLWADSAQLTEAKAVLERERETLQPERVDDVDFEAAWQQVLTSLRATPSTLGDEPAGLEDDESEEDLYDPADDDHFEPPPPPPLPRLRRVTFASLAAMLFGLVLLATNLDGGSFTVLAVVAFIGGAVSLIWNMRQGPPTDSGWDDGAVV